MKVINCQHCHHLMLSSTVLCTKCGKVNRRQARMAALCGATWIVAIGVIAAGVMS